MIKSPASNLSIRVHWVSNSPLEFFRPDRLLDPKQVLGMAKPFVE